MPSKTKWIKTTAFLAFLVLGACQTTKIENAAATRGPSDIRAVDSRYWSCFSFGSADNPYDLRLLTLPTAMPARGSVKIFDGTTKAKSTLNILRNDSQSIVLKNEALSVAIELRTPRKCVNVEPGEPCVAATINNGRATCSYAIKSLVEEYERAYDVR